MLSFIADVTLEHEMYMPQESETNTQSKKKKKNKEEKNIKNNWAKFQHHKSQSFIILDRLKRRSFKWALILLKVFKLQCLLRQSACGR